MDSFSKKISYNWIDITDEFRNQTKKLKLGELVHDSMFTLYDAMAAIELMDPKMDAGMINDQDNSRKKLYNFDDMLNEKRIKLESFEYDELIGIIDDTYSCLITWLNGHSLAQTMFINVFLHNPQLIIDKTLKTFCITILKIIDMIINFMNKAAVYEEEDFQSKTYGFDLATNINLSKILPMLKIVEDDLRNEIENNINNNSINDDKRLKMIEAILIRIRFTKHFFLCFYTFKRYLYQQNAIPLDEFIIQFNENLNSCENLFNDWLSTIHLGVKPKKCDHNTENNNSYNSRLDYPTIIGFEPLINQRLLTPSFPRFTKIKNRNETIEDMKELLKRFRELLKVKDCENLIDVIRFFDLYSQHKPSCVLSRSLLQLFYLPHEDKDSVFGERDFISIIKESCKRFIKPPILYGKLQLDQAIKELVESVFYNCSKYFKKILQIYGHNRTSQRGKLSIISKDIVHVLEQCSILEQILLNRSNCDHLSIWILFYKFYFLSKYLLTGFELELYSIHELGYIYFELDHIWNYLSLIIKRALENYIENELFLSSTNNQISINGSNNINNTNSNKNIGRKKSKSKFLRNNQNDNNRKFNFHESYSTYYKGLNYMSSAMYRLMIAIMIDKKIKTLNNCINNEEIRYKHRFAPLLQFNDHSLLQSYQTYRNCFDQYIDKNNTNNSDASSSSSSKSTKQLYIESCQLFEQAKKYFELLQNDSTFKNEVQSYIKVTKTNNIVLKLFLSGHNNNGIVDFNFAENIYFPIIRFGSEQKHKQ